MGENADPLVSRLQSILKNKYTIERELGRGGMATVYLARDVRHDRPVAIKLLQPELATAHTAERFLREIQIAAKLQHPHVLSLIDSGSGDGLVYYVMPHVDGESLRDKLLWDKYLPIDDAVSIAREVADALSYAHGQGIIHRDIKPENVLLSVGHALVADFGIARAMWDSSQPSLTAETLPLGTPAYMSPEQAGVDRTIDHRTDIYSLGCVLFEMLAGRPPFLGSSVSDIMKQHITSMPSAPSSIRERVTPELDAIVLKAMAKNPSDRFDTAEELAEALGEIGTADTEAHATAVEAPGPVETTSTPPTVTTPLPRDPSGRFYRGLIVAGMIGAMVLAALLLTGRLWKPGSSDRTRLAPLGTDPAVGVGAFRAMSTDAGSVDLARDLGPAMGTELRRNGSRVVPGDAMATAFQRGWTGQTLADSLGVLFLVEGSVEIEDRESVITVRLLDARDGSQRWVETLRVPAIAASGAASVVAREAAASVSERMRD